MGVVDLAFRTGVADLAVRTGAVTTLEPELAGSRGEDDGIREADALTGSCCEDVGVVEGCKTGSS
jgi:hypothetical protein